CYVTPVLFGDFFEGVIAVLPEHPAMAQLASQWSGALGYALHGFVTLPFWLVVAGFLVALVGYVIKPEWPPAIYARLGIVRRVLDNKYYADWFNEEVIARFGRALGRGFWQAGDRGIIDGLIVNGSARVVGMVAALSRHLQSGYIYHYALAMILGMIVFLTFFVLTVL